MSRSMSATIRLLAVLLIASACPVVAWAEAHSAEQCRALEQILDDTEALRANAKRELSQVRQIRLNLAKAFDASRQYGAAWAIYSANPTGSPRPALPELGHYRMSAVSQRYPLLYAAWERYLIGKWVQHETTLVEHVRALRDAEREMSQELSSGGCQ